MRIKITLEEINQKDIILPIHYNYLIQSFIYNNISRELADFLHNKGFEFGKRRFKMFVFSRVFSEKIRVHKDKIKFSNKIHFFISSPLKDFLSQFAEHLIKKSEFKIFNNNLILREVFVLPAIEPESKVKIKMLSPVTVYSTLYVGKLSGEQDSGIGRRKRKTYYYSPYEKEFEILIRENLRKKYESFYKEKRDFDFKIKPLKVNKNSQKIIIYKGTVIKGWLGTYEIESEKDIIKFAYDTGLGSKNSQGFGMFEIRDLGFGIRDSGIGNRDSGLGSRELGFGKARSQE